MAETETFTEEKAPASGEHVSSDTSVVTTPPEVKSVNCDCCEFTEECTTAYIARVRERFEGRWICGLCAEAVKDEIGRSGRSISKEEALERHASFCEEFRSPPEKPTEELIAAVKQLLIRSLESPTRVRSNPNTPRGKSGSDLTRVPFGRTQSCFPSMDA